MSRKSDDAAKKNERCRIVNFPDRTFSLTGDGKEERGQRARREMGEGGYAGRKRGKNRLIRFSNSLRNYRRLST